MALTKSFKKLVRRRAASDADFAASLLREGIGAMLADDVEGGTAALRDCAPAKARMRGEIVDGMRGLHKVGAVSGAELEKTKLRMLGKDAPPKGRKP